MKIAIAQVEVIPGKPFQNADMMINYLDSVRDQKPDLVVFSENVIPGYLIGDNWERSTFIDDCAQAANMVVRASTGLNVAFGNVIAIPGMAGEDGRVRKLNVTVLARNGKLADNMAAIKTLMPNYREFDDSRHFYDGRKILFEEIMESYKDAICDEINGETNELMANIRKIIGNQYKVFDINGVGVSFMLCEDGWSDDYSFKPFEILALKADLICNLSCSPYTFQKNSKRNRVFAKQCKTHLVPMVYVNNVGCQNNGKNVFVFDGNSCIYDKDGNQISPFSPFEAGITVVDVDLTQSFGKPNSSLEDEREIYEAIHYATKSFVEQNNIKNIVIGASGGMDSCLAAAIYSQILPPENIHLVNMPYKWNSKTTISIAEQLAQNIGSVYKSISIATIVDPMIETMNGMGEFSGLNIENLQARARLQILASYSSMVGGVFTCNSNKSETTVGYCTFYGDLGGFLANLADLWKTQVYSLARWFNKYIKNVIPEEAFTVKPSAELSADQNVDEGKGDPLNYEYHDKLFSVWVEKWDRATLNDVLGWYLSNTIDENLGFNGVKTLFPSFEIFKNDATRWWNSYNGLAVAKRIQSPPIVSISRRAFGFDHRESIGST